MFGQIRWTQPVNLEDFEKDREHILADLLTKKANSLAAAIVSG